MDRIQNNFSLFPKCSNINNNNSLTQADSLDIAKCCIEKCTKSYELCEKTCNNDINCKNKCIHINRNLCNDMCSLASTNLQIENDFYSCAAENGCGVNMELPDLKCVEKHTETIDNCVKSKWLPSKPNVNEYNSFYNKAPFNPEKIINNSNNDVSTVKSTKPVIKEYNDNTFTYIMYGLVIVLLLSIILIIVKIKLN